MKKLIFGVLSFLLTVTPVSAQEKLLIAPAPDGFTSPETHSYTYVVKEDGKANVYLRVDGVSIPKAGGTYTLTLPEGVTGDVLSWYRENGCREYRNDICIFYGGSEWGKVDVAMNGRTLTATVPARQVAPRDERLPVTLGIAFGTDNATSQKWWGRDVKVTTATPSNNVSYLSVGVYLPDGVIARDKQQGPSGWGAAMNAMMARDSVSAEKAAIPSGGPSPFMFDYAGGGEVTRYRPNLLPGEEYSFSFMTSTSAWKLYTQELMWGILWIVAIALVIALLLRLVVGKKSLGWYLAVMALLVLLMVLVGGLWMTYRFSFSGGRTGYGYGGPALMMEKSARDASVTAPAPAVDLPAGEPAVNAEVAE